MASVPNNNPKSAQNTHKPTKAEIKKAAREMAEFLYDRYQAHKKQKSAQKTQNKAP